MGVDLKLDDVGQRLVTGQDRADLPLRREQGVAGLARSHIGTL
jgi:hypothetical protein